MAHRRIEALLAETVDALRAADQAQATDAFLRLREALETHFDQEDHLYYPSIRGLRPELKPTLERFGSAHDAFRSTFASIHDHLEAGLHAEARDSLEKFGQAFSVHEVEEEEMLQALDRELELPG